MDWRLVVLGFVVFLAGWFWRMVWRPAGRWVVGPRRRRVTGHVCRRPWILPWRATGSVWRCAHCGQDWRVHESWGGTDTWREWRLVSPDGERVT